MTCHQILAAVMSMMPMISFGPGSCRVTRPKSSDFWPQPVRPSVRHHAHALRRAAAKRLPLHDDLADQGNGQPALHFAATAEDG